MPIYEFRCKSCERIFEHLMRSMSEKEDVACPFCQGIDVEKTLSVFAAHQGSSRPVPKPCGGCSAADGVCPYNP
ncbi:MAG: zinc ribbon domain-containing protein [Phycisphaerales bacterium]|nr:MAG: zinc ribbon domain-containing protein [Phycisphaerales bacterium]